MHRKTINTQDNAIVSYSSLSRSPLSPCFQCKIIIYYHTYDTNILISPPAMNAFAINTQCSHRYTYYNAKDSTGTNTHLFRTIDDERGKPASRESRCWQSAHLKSTWRLINKIKNKTTTNEARSKKRSAQTTSSLTSQAETVEVEPRRIKWNQKRIVEFVGSV